MVLVEEADCYAPESQLIVCAKSGNVSKLTQILDKGVHPDSELGVSGWSPLMHAAARGHFDMCEMLISRNANVNFTNKTEHVPLHWAARRCHSKIIKLLLENGADSHRRNNQGMNAMDLAKRNYGVSDVEYRETVQILQEFMDASDLGPKAAFMGVAAMEEPSTTESRPEDKK